MNKPLKSVVSSQYQQGVLLQLSDIRQKIVKLGPAPKFTLDTALAVNDHRNKLYDFLTDARIAASVALPPAILQELTSLSTLVTDLALGKEHTKE